MLMFVGYYRKVTFIPGNLVLILFFSCNKVHNEQTPSYYATFLFLKSPFCFCVGHYSISLRMCSQTWKQVEALEQSWQRSMALGALHLSKVSGLWVIVVLTLQWSEVLGQT